jgi:dihydropteroate synthase
MSAPDASRPTPDASPPVASLRLGRYSFTLDRPLIMGVVNVTPDSFSDGGQFYGARAAVEHARRLVDEGVDILDVGGESTRPGASPVDAEEELRRIRPVLEAMADGSIAVSVDTSKPEVMRAAIDAGAAMINDIYALRQPSALETVAASDVGVCVMHMQGEPRTMQDDPVYGDVVAEVKAFLDARVAACTAAGIGRDRIVIDPGFGFGKKAVHNLELIRGIPTLAASGLPVLAGLSRKSVLGRITGRMVGDRIHSSVAAALVAVARGARIVRVHDVAATRDALAVWTAVEAQGMDRNGR